MAPRAKSSLLTAEEFAAIERTMAKAHALGIKLETFSTFLGHSFTWVMPDGKRVSGSVQRDRDVALLVACKDLLPHIFIHV